MLRLATLLTSLEMASQSVTLGAYFVVRRVVFACCYSHLLIHAASFGQANVLLYAT